MKRAFRLFLLVLITALLPIMALRFYHLLEPERISSGISDTSPQEASLIPTASGQEKAPELTNAGDSRNQLEAMTKKNRSDIRAYLENLYKNGSANTEEQRLIQLYQLYCGQDARIIEPAVEDIQYLQRISSPEMLCKAAGLLQLRNAGGFFTLESMRDQRTGDTYALYLSLPQLSLSNAALYLEDGTLQNEKTSLRLKQADILCPVLERLGVTNPSAAVTHYQSVEKQIAELMVLDEGTDSNPTTAEAFYDQFQYIPMSMLFDSVGILPDDTLYCSPILSELDALFGQEIETMRDYLIVGYIIKMVLPYTNYEMLMEKSVLDAVTAIESYPEQDEAAFQLLLDDTGWLVTNCFSGKLSFEEQQEIRSLAKEILDEFVQMASESGLYSPKGLANAQKKLDAMNLYLGYPSYLADTSDLREPIPGESLYQYVVSLRESRTRAAIAANGRAIGVSSPWYAYPYLANALYSPHDNSIYLLAGLLEDPVYQTGMDRELLLSQLGFVIAHEAAHSIDPDGIRFDANGVLLPDQENAILAENSRDLQEQISAAYGYATHQSVLELWADLQAMECILRLSAPSDPQADSALLKQLTALWIGDEQLESSPLYGYFDPHYPGRFRVNFIVSHFDRLTKVSSPYS